MAGKGGESGVGYGKPPVATRFKKGASGNPKGRPKGAKSLATIVDETSREKVNIKLGGKQRRVQMSEAIMLRVNAQAVNGNLRAAGLHIGTRRLCGAVEQPKELRDVSVERDRAVMKSILKRMKKVGDEIAGKEKTCK